MEVKGIVLREEVVKKTATIKESDWNTIEGYHEFVEETVGQEVSMTELLGQLAVTLVNKDRGFKNWLKSQEKPKKTEKVEEVKEVSHEHSHGHNDINRPNNMGFPNSH